MKKVNIIGAERLFNQALTGRKYLNAEEAVSHFGGMQGQDLPGVKWSLARRMAGEPNLQDINRAFDSGEIVRTWPMRGTLHVVPSKDIKWMLSLTSPRNLKGSATRRKNLELDEVTLNRCADIIIEVLQGNNLLTREELYDAIERHGISTSGQRGYHILYNLSLKGIICFGGIRGIDQSVSLVDEWVRGPNNLETDEALGELAKRYFTSHGPATIQDYIWWSGLTSGEAKKGLEIVKGNLRNVSINGKEYWTSQNEITEYGKSEIVLSGFDEYMLGYKDRSDTLPIKYSNQVCPGNNGVFIPTLILNGDVVGTWKRTNTKTKVKVQLLPFEAEVSFLKNKFQKSLEEYSKYLGLGLEV